ncbi:MAG: FAD binding domain-containing protein [Deltaproteobacteria bacterium]|nr:FAD binding domain-containing protein [Deltaproteobacteria bacterium]
MKNFEWVQPETVADAVAALGHPGAMALAGGVDLLDRLKERLDSPSRLVSLRKLPNLSEIKVAGGVATIGANVTLARLAADPALQKSHRIISDAAGHAATPQLRAMATIGGNLAQRPRCWYFRSEEFVCRKKGGAECFAQEGDNSMHAVFDNKLCAATHPSTVVTALIALGARVTIAGAKAREVELASFFVKPETDVRREVDLASGELITGLSVPASAANLRTAYTKQVAKQSFDWPLVDVAVALVMDGQTCRQATIVLGAVAPTPRRAVEAERVLAGATVDVLAAGRAARAAIASASPLAHNDHKVQILETVLARTIMNAAAGRAS